MEKLTPKQSSFLSNVCVSSSGGILGVHPPTDEGFQEALGNKEEHLGLASLFNEDRPDVKIWPLVQIQLVIGNYLEHSIESKYEQI